MLLKVVFRELLFANIALQLLFLKLFKVLLSNNFTFVLSLTSELMGGEISCNNQLFTLLTKYKFLILSLKGALSAGNHYFSNINL